MEFGLKEKIQKSKIRIVHKQMENCDDFRFPAVRTEIEKGEIVMTQERKVDFGFGCMRLPVLQADQPDSFDYGKINQLFDAFL